MCNGFWDRIFAQRFNEEYSPLIKKLFLEKTGKKVSVDLDLGHVNDAVVLRVRPINSRPLFYYQATFSTFPGNPHIIISNNVILYPPLRGKGIGSKLLDLRISALRLLAPEVEAVMCTVRQDNKLEVSILRKQGFTTLRHIPNDYGNGKVNLMWKEL